LHVTNEHAWFYGGIVTKLPLSASGVVLTPVFSTTPVLTFRNFSLRCDKSDPQISFQSPWNWELGRERRIALISNNSYLKFQLIASLADLAEPVTGEVISEGIISWPVGGEGGLDKKLRISHAINFLSNIYGDCLDESKVSLDEFWSLLSEMKIYPTLIIRELSRSQKDFFYLALSVLFSFDFYLIPRTNYLMSRTAKPLRALLLKQLEGKSLLTTSTNSRFRREFCTEGLVLGSLGEILFFGELSDAIHWADNNLEARDISGSDEDQFDIGLNLVNSESETDDQFDL